MAGARRGGALRLPPLIAWMIALSALLPSLSHGPLPHHSLDAVRFAPRGAGIPESHCRPWHHVGSGRGWEPTHKDQALVLRGGSDNEPTPMQDGDELTKVSSGTGTLGLQMRPPKQAIPGLRADLMGDFQELVATGPTKRAVRIKWKTRVFDMEIDTAESVAKLKNRLCELTKISPDRQNLIGVYCPGQDADLRSKDIKNGQTLLLLGEPTLEPAAVGRMQEGAKEVWLPDGFVVDPGVRSKIRGQPTTAETEKILNGSYAHEISLHGAPIKPSIEPPDGAYEREQAAKVDALIKRGKDAFKKRATRIDPGTLPKELLNKRVSQYTQEDRNRLMAWLNETRHWHFNETLTKLEEEEKEHSTAVQRVAADETATLENDAMRQTEKELNVYGASIEKSYNAITRSVELMMTSDILVNQSKYLEHEHELAGGMNPDIIPQFEQDLEELAEIAAEGNRRLRQDAVQRDFEYRAYSRALDAEVDAEPLDRRPEPTWRDDFWSESDWDASGFEEKGEYEEYWDRELWHEPEVVRDLQDAGLHKWQRRWCTEMENRRRVLHALRRLRTNREKRMSFLVAYGWPRSNCEFPYGLYNIGNTCYLASVLQLLRCVPELMWDIAWFEPRDPSSTADRSENLVHASKKLFRMLGSKPIQFMDLRPYTLVHHLRVLYPQFAEMGMGGPAQQDAEECLIALLQTFGSVLRDDAGSSKVHELFELEIENTVMCAENKAEEETVEHERMLRLPLHIDGKTSWIHDCIKNALNTNVEKTSPTLGRDAGYNVTGKISKLPPYLLTHFVRFYWRQDTKKKAKICRTVQFPFVLDLMPYLTDELRFPIERRMAERKADYLRRNPIWEHADQDDELSRKWAEYEKREARREQREARRAKVAKALAAVNMSLEEDESVSDDDEENVRMKSRLQNATSEPEVPADYGRTIRGASIVDESSVYELRGIITHEGRYADAGHYICWVKSGIRVPKKSKSDQSPEEYYWLKFDDHKVTLEYEEDVKNTAGGADGPIVYIALYGRCGLVGEGMVDDRPQARKRDRRDRDELRRHMQPYAEQQTRRLWEEYQRHKKELRRWN